MATRFYGSSSEVCVRLRQSAGKVSALLKDLNQPAEERFTLTSRTLKLVNKTAKTETHSSLLKARTNGPLHFKARARRCGLSRKSLCKVICFLSQHMNNVYFFSPSQAFNSSLTRLTAEMKGSSLKHPSVPKYSLTGSVRHNKLSFSFDITVLFCDESLSSPLSYIHLLVCRRWKRQPYFYLVFKCHVVILMLQPHVLINSGNKAHIQLL